MIQYSRVYKCQQPTRLTVSRSLAAPEPVVINDLYAKAGASVGAELLLTQLPLFTL